MYVLIAKYFACKVIDDEYKEGEALPSRDTIAAQFGVKPLTASRGLRLLMHLGYAWPAVNGYKAHMPEEPVLPHGSLVPMFNAVFGYLDAIESELRSIKSGLQSVQSKLDLLIAAKGESPLRG